jgi:hypothetical protein
MLAFGVSGPPGPGPHGPLSIGTRGLLRTRRGLGHNVYNKARFSEVYWGQITSFWLLRQLLGMAHAPSFPVRVARERGDGTDSMRLGGQPDRLD